MKKLVLLMLGSMVLLPLRCGVAQTSRPLSRAELEELQAQSKEKEIREEELTNLERETVRAMQWNTGTFFRRVYGEEFEGIVPSGQIMKKAAYIAAVENSNVKYSLFVASDIRVKMYEETAVVTCLWSSRGVRNGKEFSRQFRVTHVYVYGQRGWQAVASQETLLPG